MSPARLFVLLGAAALATAGACNSGMGTCPASQSIQPGGSCSDNQLQCEYDLATPSAACDGTTTVIPSSCVCTDGVWVCPSPFSCDGGAPPAEDGSTSADGGADAAVDSGLVDAGAATMPDSGRADAAADARNDGP